MPGQTEEATLARCVLMDLIQAFAQPASFAPNPDHGLDRRRLPV